MALILPLDHIEFKENDIFGCDWCSRRGIDVLFVNNGFTPYEYRCMDHFQFVAQPK